jgi:hypothetical protein
MRRLTEGRESGRLLTRTETLLCDYLDNERQAVALAPHVFIPEGLTFEEESAMVEKAIVRVLVDALENSVGFTNLVYVGGERRDTLRG